MKVISSETGKQLKSLKSLDCMEEKVWEEEICTNISEPDLGKW
jgi:hypothetical protein